ncbi:T9SS type A sorting domain-containing protein [Flavobacterium sp.]|uniref:DUF7619 domain-containing protein n=1 Tax=Flavobacterium sp. TaxID=239 RepID=UPI002610DDCD|nr:T9SS type A sorting domain-containing protein [Flavobacterium sp.]
MKKLYFSLCTLFFFFGANAQIVNIPDANFKAKLLSASADNQVASIETPNVDGNVNTFTSIDTNNDGEIQVSEASVIKYLNLIDSSITNLDGISSFTNLIYLNCSQNQLLSLNLDGLTNLRFLLCNNTQISSLNVSGLLNLEFLSCSAIYDLSSLNVNGLTNLKFLGCDSCQLTSLDVQGLINLEGLYCADNQITSLNLQGLVNLNRLSCMLNNLSSLNVQGLTSLVDLECPNNQLTSLNLQGLTSLNRLVCNDNQLTSLDLQGLFNLQNIFCDYNQLASLSIKNGIGFNYLFFNNNPNLLYICADEDEIDLVQSMILSLGYTNCHVNSYCSFTPGGTNYTIQGSNKFDGNSNGCDATDGFYPNLKYSISDGTNSGSLISNTSGNYSISVAAGTHTIAPQLENLNYFSVSPTSATVSFPVTASPFVQDFCIIPNGVHHDLEVVIIPLEPARPGFDATYKIKYKNKGTVSENPTIVFNFDDDILDYVSSTLAPTTTSTGLLSWSIGSIVPFQSGEFVVTLNVNSPMETPAVNGGDILSSTATINGTSADEYIRDNTFPLRQIVVNSYDPNDKTCLEGTTINPTMIGEYVHYQIRFENTGTFAAQNIVVKDMIDATTFDIATLQIIESSHNCVTKITNPNKVEFIFENINLPFEDATNDGYLVFKIKTKPTLTVGSTISNLANIYFDYNFPIVTNTATSTFQSLANNTFNFENYVSLAPSPAKDILNITIQKEVSIKSISIYNMLGQLVQIITNPSNSINVSDLETGNYIIKLQTENGEIIRKFIKE